MQHEVCINKNCSCSEKFFYLFAVFNQIVIGYFINVLTICAKVDFSEETMVIYLLSKNFKRKYLMASVGKHVHQYMYMQGDS